MPTKSVQLLEKLLVDTSNPANLQFAATAYGANSQFCRGVTGRNLFLPLITEE